MKNRHVWLSEFLRETGNKQGYQHLDTSRVCDCVNFLKVKRNIEIYIIQVYNDFLHLLYSQIMLLLVKIKFFCGFYCVLSDFIIKM